MNPERLPNRRWNSDRAAAIEETAQQMERDIATGGDCGHRVYAIDRASLERVYKFIVIDNHDHGDEDVSR